MTLASVALAAAPGVAGAPPSDCRVSACTGSLRVGDTPVAWRSPELFYPRNERLYVDLTSSNRTLTLTRSYGRNPCRHRFAGAGMSVMVNACGNETPIRVRAVRVRAESARLQVAYAAAPILGDAPAPAPPSRGDATTVALKPITGA